MAKGCDTIIMYLFIFKCIPSMVHIIHSSIYVCIQICLIRVISGLLIKPVTFINKLLYCAKDCLIDFFSIPYVVFPLIK